MITAKKLCCSFDTNADISMKSPMDNGYKRQRFNQILKSHQWSDCTFMIDDRKVPAHKLILVCSSPVFETMFYGDLATSEPIEIKDTSYDDFVAMLNYLYTDCIEIESVHQAWNLIYLCEKYILDDNLRQLCIKYIRNHLTINTLALSYENSIFYNMTDLTKLCLNDMLHFLRQFMLFSNYHMNISTLQDLFKFTNSKTLGDNVQSWWLYLVMGTINWAVQECVNENSTVTSGNVWEVIVKNDLAKYFCKFNFRKFTSFGNFSPEEEEELVQLSNFCEEIYQNFIREAPPENFVCYKEEEPVGYITQGLGLYTKRNLYKNIETVRFHEMVYFDSYFEVDRDCFLNGILVNTLQRSVVSDTISLTNWMGNVQIYIKDEQNKIVHEDGKSCQYVFDYRDGCAVDFGLVVLLRAQRKYKLTVRYSVPRAGQILVQSFSPEHQDKCTTFKFIEPKNSVVAGLSCYPL